MKKLFALAATVLLFATSCSSDDAQPIIPVTEPVEVVLVKKIRWEDPVLGTMITTYNYDNQNKIISEIKAATPGGTYYTYTNDLITKIELKDDNNNLIKGEIFEYDSNNKLAVYKIHWPDLESTGQSTFKNVYTYNSNGTINIDEYNGTETSQTHYLSTTILTISEGNIVNSAYNGFFGSLSKSYVFDNNNSPFKNVTGYNAVILARKEGGLNNIIVKNASADNSISNFTYDNLSYPLLEHNISEEVEITKEFFYE